VSQLPTVVNTTRKKTGIFELHKLEMSIIGWQENDFQQNQVNSTFIS
jgi:hypothetical protein